MRNRISPLLLAVVVMCVVPATTSGHYPHDDAVQLEPSPNFDEDHTAFVIVRGNLYRTDDGGGMWRRRQRGLCHERPTTIAISPSFAEDRTAFAACSAGHVYRSVDGGQSWVRVWMDPKGPVRQLAISPGFGRDGSVVVRNEVGQLSFSTDAGASWQAMDSRGQKIDHAAWLESGLIASTADGVKIRTPDGRSWRTVRNLPENVAVTCVEAPGGTDAPSQFFLGTREHGVLRVEDDEVVGRSDPRAMANERVTGLASMPDQDGSTLLYATTWHQAVYRSEDDGVTWRLSGRGLETNGQADHYRQPHFRGISSAGSSLFVCGFAGLYRSDDRGERWFKSDVTLHTVTGLDVATTGESSFRVVVATYCGGAFLSDGEGRDWVNITTGMGSPRPGPIAFSKSFHEDGRIHTATFGRSMTSLDGGATWVANPALSKEWLLTQRPWRAPVSADSNGGRQAVDGAVAGVVADEALRLRLSGSLKKEAVVATALVTAEDPESDGVVFAALSPFGVFRSNDAGRSFETVWHSKGELVRSLVVSPAFFSDRTVFAAVGQGCFRSTDAGQSWSQIGDPGTLLSAELAVSPSFATDSTVFAGAEAGLFVSRDRGSSWRRVGIVDAAIPEQVTGLAVSPDFARDRTILVQLARDGLFVVRDGEDGFVAVESDAAANGHEFSHSIRFGSPLIRFSPHFRTDRTVFAASGKDVLRSTNGGLKWHVLRRPLYFEAEAVRQEVMPSPIVASGRWWPGRSPSYSASRALSTRVAGSSLTFRFTGSEVAWLGEHGPNQGTATVYLDGRRLASVSQRAESSQAGVTSFVVGYLPPGPHELKIVVDRRDPREPEDGRVTVDALIVTP